MGARISTGKDSKQDYKTPADFMASVVRRFGPITFDLAARDYNTQSPNYFAPCTGPEGPLPRDPKAVAMDSLEQPWAHMATSRFRREGSKGLLWLNPEFGDIPTWATKCKEESYHLGANILMLSPASVGSNWFCDLIAGYADVYLLKPRLSFIPGQLYNKDCMMAHYCYPEDRSFGPFRTPSMGPDGAFCSHLHRYISVWNWKTNVIEHVWSTPYIIR